MHTKAPPPIDSVEGLLSSALLRTYFEANHLNRLEMALQACVYEHRDGLGLEEFFQSAARALEEPALKEAMAELQRARPEAP